MLTPAAKRRRAEAATATLSRPFRSPSLRHVVARAAKVTRDNSETASDVKTLSATKKDPVVCPGLLQKTLSSAASPELGRKRTRSSSCAERVHKVTSVDQPLSLSGLLDHFSDDLDAGDRVIVQARAAAHTGGQQAEAGTDEKRCSDNNKDLRSLIARWKTAGQLAADDVFSLVSERVERLGGVKAWLAMGTQPMERECGSTRRGAIESKRDRWDNDRAVDSDRSDAEDENESSDGENGVVEEEDTQNFTMSLMLANLNVDRDLLGYDETEERWKD
ncbi:MAG: hypothetical protein SEPTF4163_000288 [Sporothrix epigloea]